VEAEGARPEERSQALGYGLMAAAALLSLAGLLFQARSPFGVLGRPPLLAGSVDLLLQASSRARLERLDRAVDAYRLDHGMPPKTLEQLIAEGLVDKQHLSDPWSRPYHYEASAASYRLNAVDDAGKPQPGTLIERAFSPARP
jgi:hypothetical protein